MDEKQHWTAVVRGQAAGFFFFIDGREMSSEDVSMADVNLELRADSRKRHCRMMIRDSTSQAARERKTRTLRERSPLMTFSRKLSLMMRMRALTDGHWRAIRAVLLAVLL